MEETAGAVGVRSHAEHGSDKKFTSKRACEPGSSSKAGLPPSPALLIEKLSPRLPGESDFGVFKGSGPGNDGGGHPCDSFLIELMASYKQQLTYNQ